MTPEELERYARHIVLREIGGSGQQKLIAARVAVVGAGGLGAPVLLYLAAAGVGRLTVIDGDQVSLSNLQRQVIFETGQIGEPKASAASERIAALNPHIEVAMHPVRLDECNAQTLLAEHDLIIDGSDNFDTRYLVNRIAVGLGIPLLSAAMSQWEGQISLYDPGSEGPCYQCVFPERPAPGLAPSCAEAGIVGALAGVMGSLIATEAIKEICGIGEGLRGRLLIYDALGAEFRKLKVAKWAGCTVCGDDS